MVGSLTVTSGLPFEKQIGYSRAVRAGNMVFVAGATANDVVRWRVYLTNVNDWPAVLEEISKVFGEAAPAATLVEVKGLISPASLVEIEVDAVVGLSG